MKKSKGITYDDAIMELNEIVQQLENESVSIDELTQLVQRASELTTFCREKIFKTEQEVEKILKELEKSNL